MQTLNHKVEHLLMLVNKYWFKRHFVSSPMKAADVLRENKLHFHTVNCPERDGLSRSFPLLTQNHSCWRESGLGKTKRAQTLADCNGSAVNMATAKPRNGAPQIITYTFMSTQLHIYIHMYLLLLFK